MTHAEMRNSTCNTMYKDGDWELNTSTPDDVVPIWLYHPCDDNGLNPDMPRHVFRHARSRRGAERALAAPCSFCGSVCPAGLRGMYLTMVML